MPPSPSSVETPPAGGGESRHPGWQLVCLWCLDPDCRGELVELGSKPLPIGRQVDPRIGLEFTDPKMSRVHCEILWNGERFALRDLESRNGTWLNGRRIRREVLAPGDVIRLSDTVLMVDEIGRSGREAIAGAGMVGISRELGACVERA